jgi:phage-related protein
MAAGIGAQLQNLGVDQATAASNTGDLITMGADLAATFGGSTADAVNALGSALRGEADPAERYGLALNQTAVNAKMAADGTDKLTGQAYSTAKAQAVLALATEQSAKSAGTFAKESDTAEGSAARAAATNENAAAAIGQGLLPAYTALQGVMKSVGEFMQENSTLVLVLMGVIGGLAAAVLIVNAAMAVASAATAAWTAIQTIASGITTGFTAVMGALNAVMAANPVLLVVIAVVALIAGIILLWNNCEAFRNFVMGMWEAIAAAATAAWSAISSAASTAWNAVSSLVGSVISAISSAVSTAGGVIVGIWNSIRSAAESVWNAIGSLVSSVVSGVSSAVSGIVGGIVGAWNSIRSAAESAWQAIVSVVQSVTSTISSTVSGIQSGINAVWSAIQRAGEAVWAPIQAAAAAAMGVIQGLIDGVMSAISGIGSAIQGAIGWAGDLLGKITGAGNAAAAVPGGTMAVGPTVATSSPSLARAGLLGAGRSAPASSAGGVSIVVNGALDPDAVARQIESILRGRGRRTGGVIL